LVPADGHPLAHKFQGDILEASTSKDGNTLHDDFTYISENGKMVHLVYVYQRRGEGSGFAGDWVSTSEQVDASYIVLVKPFGGDGLSIVDPPIRSQET
jgi:hypothetical protein